MEDKITGVVVDIPTVIREAKQSKWISVKDMLPDCKEYGDVWVLVAYYDDELEVWQKHSAVYFKAEDIFCYTQGCDTEIKPTPTHWMALPADPKDI
jgi:hypothetical protein